MKRTSVKMHKKDMIFEVVMKSNEAQRDDPSPHSLLVGCEDNGLSLSTEDRCPIVGVWWNSSGGLCHLLRRCFLLELCVPTSMIPFKRTAVLSAVILHWSSRAGLCSCLASVHLPRTLDLAQLLSPAPLAAGVSAPDATQTTAIFIHSYFQQWCPCSFASSPQTRETEHNLQGLSQRGLLSFKFKLRDAKDRPENLSCILNPA